MSKDYNGTAELALASKYRDKHFKHSIAKQIEESDAKKARERRVTGAFTLVSPGGTICEASGVFADRDSGDLFARVRSGSGWSILPCHWGPAPEVMPEPPAAAADANTRLRRSRRKLSDEAVREIRRRIAAGETQTAISKDLGCSQTTVWQVARGKTYTDVPDAPTT